MSPTADQTIATLEAQHRALEKDVGAINAALAAGDHGEAMRVFQRMGLLLTGHAQLENTQFYPRMIALAQERGSPHVRQSAQLFADNMRRIAEAAVAFFDRWNAGFTDLARFQSEWAGIVDVLVRRIRDEEQTLHPMLRRLSAG